MLSQNRILFNDVMSYDSNLICLQPKVLDFYPAVT